MAGLGLWQDVSVDSDPSEWQPPLNEPWASLLSPLSFKSPHRHAEVATALVHCVQLADERLPYMAIIGVDDPRLISEHDFARLAWADALGNSAIQLQQNFF